MNGADGKFIGYGLGDTGPDVAKVQHRLIYAYPAASKAVELGVIEYGVFDLATQEAVWNFQQYINDHGLNNTLLGQGERKGVADYATRVRMKAYIPPVLGPKYKIQGVWYNTTAYLMPPDAPSFNKDCAQAAAEGQRLITGQVRDSVIKPTDDIIGIGYSMGAKALREFEMTLTPAQLARYKLSINFGDPSMRPQGSLLGDDPGEGISKAPHPDSVADRYYSYSIEGDWYPRARGLLFFLYDVISRAELSLEFATWLLTQFPKLAMQQLMGLQDSNDDTGAAGILAPLAGIMTRGPINVLPVNPVANLINPLQLLALLPQLIELLVDAVKFVSSNAHGMYGDPGHALWEGMTGVDHAVKTIREKCPNGATLLLFPGSWAQWNQGFQYDVAARLTG